MEKELKSKAECRRGWQIFGKVYQQFEAWIINFVFRLSSVCVYSLFKKKKKHQNSNGV